MMKLRLFRKTKTLIDVPEATTSPVIDVELMEDESMNKLIQSSNIISSQKILVFIVGINLNREIILPTERSKFLADRPINLYALYPGIMMCYTNFIKHSMVGSDFYPLFRTIPLADKSSREDEYISVHFDNFEFHKINTTRVDFL